MHINISGYNWDFEEDQNHALYFPDGSFTTINDITYVFSGTMKNSPEIDNNIRVYNTSTGKIQQTKKINIMKEALAFNQLIANDGSQYIYLVGGQKTSEICSQPLKSTWKFDIISEKFTLLSNLPECRRGGSLTFFNGHLHYIGGSYTNTRKSGKSKITAGLKASSHFTLDVMNSSSKWVLSEPFPFPIQDHTAVVLLDRQSKESLFVIGGQSAFDSCFNANKQSITAKTNTYNSIYKFTIEENRKYWTNFSTLPFGLINPGKSVILSGSALILFGGKGLSPNFRKGLVEEGRSLQPITLFYPFVNETKIIFRLPESVFGFNKETSVRLVENTRSCLVLKPRTVRPREIQFNYGPHSIWFIQFNKDISETNTVFKVTGPVYWRDLLIHKYETSGSLLDYEQVKSRVFSTSSREMKERLNLFYPQRSIYLLPTIDGGISNLKLHIIASAEIALQNNLTLILPNLPNDFLTDRGISSISNSLKFKYQKCFSMNESRCDKFSNFFNIEKFEKTCNLVGVKVLRNGLPTWVQDFPFEYLKNHGRGWGFKSIQKTPLLFDFPGFHLCHGGCHKFQRFNSTIIDLSKSYGLGASISMIGINPYFQVVLGSKEEIIRRNKLLKGLEPSDDIKTTVNEIVEKLPKSYNSVHLRIEDDLKVFCSSKGVKEFGSIDCFLPIETIIKRLLSHFKLGSTVYVAMGNNSKYNQTIEELSKHFQVLTKTQLIPKILDKYQNKRELLGLIDQEVCLKSEVFIGSKLSSFSFIVAALRGINGKKWVYYNPLFLGDSVHSPHFVRNSIENYFYLD